MTDAPASNRGLDPAQLAQRLDAPGGAAHAADFRHPDASACGHFGIRIARDGTWFYHGSPISRKPLVRLFATILRRDDAGGYWLVTPAERGRIDVDDAPFTAVALTVTGSGTGQHLTFRTNLDAEVTADAAHPIRVAEDPQTGEPSPYILVRDNLEALIVRSVFYQLVDLAVPSEDGEALGVWSAHRFFPLGKMT